MIKQTSLIVVGLDIGTTKICAIVGRKNEFGKIEILGKGQSESIGVMRGVVSNIDHTVQSIKLAVDEASKKSGIEIKEVVVGIAGQHIKSMQHRGMKTRRNSEIEIAQSDIDSIVEDMYKLAMLPGEEIIHVIPQEFVVDNEQGIKEPVGMFGVWLEAKCHIITGQTSAVRNIVRCVEKAGLSIDYTTDLILEPLASSEAVLTEEEKEAGVALVDIGGGTTDIAIFKDGIIRHTAVIPFGGNVITEDIKEGCSIIKKQAEMLKVKFGSALASENQENERVSIQGLRGKEPKEISVKNLANIIQARMEEIIEHIYYELKNSGYEKKLIAGIVITGGGAQLKHISQLVEYMTGLDTRIGYPNEHLATGPIEEVKSPMYATGVGLVLMGLNKTVKEVAHQIPETGLEIDEPTDTIVEPPIQPTIKPEPQKRSSFFDNLFKKSKEWLDEDNNDRIN